MTEVLELPSNKKVIRILSMDGGGVRGVAVARILEEIETVCKKPIHELFDVVVGTSTGGLLSIMMTCPTNYPDKHIMSAEEAKNFYLNEGTTIFPPKSIFQKALDYTILLPKTFSKPKYSPEGLESVIRGHYGDKATLASAKVCAGIVGSDIRYAESMVFNSVRAKLHPEDYRHNATLIEVGRATSAAPIYLPPIMFRDPLRRIPKQRQPRKSVAWNSLEAPEYLRDHLIYEDGGTTHNNPVELAYKLARLQLKAHGYNHEDFQFQVISIGTGSESGTEVDPTIKERGWKKESADGGFDNVIRRVFLDDVFSMKVKEWRAHLKVRGKLGHKEGAEPGSNYWRIQFELGKGLTGQMDNSKRVHMDALVRAAETYLFKDGSKEYTDSFKSLTAYLSKECERPQFDSKEAQESLKATKENSQQPLQANKFKTDGTSASASETSSITHEHINTLIQITSPQIKLTKHACKTACC